MMLRWVAAQVESLFDDVPPAGVRELPPDLARPDEVLAFLERHDETVDAGLSFVHQHLDDASP